MDEQHYKQMRNDPATEPNHPAHQRRHFETQSQNQHYAKQPAPILARKRTASSHSRNSHSRNRGSTPQDKRIKNSITPRAGGSGMRKPP